MSFEPMTSQDGPRSGSSAPAWFYARPLWAGLSIITMWLAVLFVGLFGGNIISSTPGGTSTSVPVVIVVLPFVLPATIAVARRGFRETEGDRREATAGADDDSAREAATLRPKHA